MSDVAGGTPPVYASTDERAYTAASMYYLQGETMEVVARHLGVSRSTVSRLLAHARSTGLVRIELERPTGDSAVVRRLREEFGVRARLVPVRRGATEIHRLRQVATVAAEQLTGYVTPGSTVGVAWGTTVSEIALSLHRATVPDVTVVQLNGASDAVGEAPFAGEVLSRIGEAFGARTVAFPVPAFFDRVEVREAMWKERSIRRVLALADHTDVAVFGVGSVRGAVPSQVYQGEHLTMEDRRTLREEGVVGDVCTVLLRADGTYRGIALNARATGPTPAQLAHIPVRLCAVAGEAKAPALLAALRARVATDLVVDEATAYRVVEILERRR
ncbi:transcriptional regulator [Actinomyces sp. 2119]|uniref:Transcriptional regulator n=1 Tax=Actinomyces lilanjuaniae TaxID=2321394 RepID=A0ABM6Z267_9ACTO|nr:MULTISPECIES: sugar-binding domain-containing protein [Actinomyces]AYD89255.1 transcriptional regulator [Actinomyces lilanjuaniae]RJF40669.1 transcriptional regulator [Actinomyces sp. 2119]